MSILNRHYLLFNIALFDYVVPKRKHIKVLYDVVLNFHFFYEKMKINFAFLPSNLECRNLSFIENYFYLMGYSFVNQRMNLIKLKKLPDQLIIKLSCTN